MASFHKSSYARLVKSADGKSWYLQGYASNTDIDRDGDRMSRRAILQMKEAMGQGMTLFGDHAHGLFDSLGVITKAEDTPDGKLYVEARLEDPDKNPKVAQLLHKLEIGERIGLSIGGDLASSHTVREGNKNIRIIDDVKLYELSAVGIPSNADSYVVGSVYKGLNPNNLQKLSPDDLIRLRNPMQPEGKIAAEPGKSGSSEVFRTDVGGKPAGPQDDSWNTASPYSNAKPTDGVILSEEDEAKRDAHRFECQQCKDGDAANWQRHETAYTGGPAPIFGQGKKSLRKDVIVNLNITDGKISEPNRTYDQRDYSTPVPDGVNRVEGDAYSKEEQSTVPQTRGMLIGGGEAGGKGEEEDHAMSGNPKVRMEEDEEDLQFGPVGTGASFSEEVLRRAREESKKDQPYSGRPQGAMGTKSIGSPGIMKRAIGGWQSQMAQEQVSKDNTERMISDAEDYREIHERLHNLGLPHDGDICTHCNPIPSRQNEHMQPPKKKIVTTTQEIPLGTDGAR